MEKLRKRLKVANRLIALFLIELLTPITFKSFHIQYPKMDKKFENQYI